MPERAVLYARISLDRTGEQAGVTRQMNDMRQLAEARDFEVVEEVTDNDISATKGLRRAGYERVWELVTTGKVDHVICWQSSRFMRSRKDRAEVISTFGKHEVDIIAVKGPSLDLRSASGRFAADLLTSMNTVESEILSERVTAAIADLARRGRPHGVCPYGWDRIDGKQVINEHEAGVVRELVDRLLTGESLNALYRDMNARNEPAPGWAVWMKIPEQRREQLMAKGRVEPTKVWAKATIRTLVQRDANVAVRCYRKKADGGTEIAGDWPAIINRDKHDRLMALMGAPGRRSHTGPRPGARKHLLTNGIGKCGVCGDLLRVGNRARSQGPIYMCRSHGCTGRVQAPVDELLGKVVIGRMAKPDALDWLLGDDDQARRASERCDDLQRRLDDAADQYADGKITGGILERISARITPELEAAKRERNAALRSVDIETLQKLAGPEAAAQWKAMSVPMKRAALESLGVTVTLKPRRLHGPGFEADTVQVSWPTRASAPSSTSPDSITT